MNRRNRRGRLFGSVSRRKRLPLVLLFLLVAGVASGACYLLSKEPAPAGASGNPTVTPTVTPTMVVTPTGAVADGEQKQTVYGPFGLWDPTPTPTPTIIIPEGEEIWMADFVDNRTPISAKGIYVTADVAKTSEMDQIIAMLDRTELNSVVIDVKADSGAIVYAMDNDMAKEIGATRSIIADMPKLMKKLKEHNIYVIARVVAFKDPILAKARPELCFYNVDGSKFYDSSNTAWVSPYKKEVWEYLVNVGIGCAEAGFDEINFDYFRFPTDGVSNIDWGKEAEETTKIEAITACAKYVCEELRMHDIFISADVYGAIINSSVDAKAVGQDYAQLSRYLDYICPMVYPSHYGFGYANVEYPDKEPAKIIGMALKASAKKLDEIPVYQHRAICRPWLQDFTASYLGTNKKTGEQRYLTYDADVLRIEIETVYESGLTDWFLWNASVKYTEAGLLKDEQ